MALHSSDKRVQVLPNGEVMQDGYSFGLAIDQLGVFSVKQKSKNGLKAISDFNGIDKNFEKLKMLVGTDDTEGVTGSNKNSSSIHFTLDEVSKVGIAYPKNQEQKVDYFRIGWNGVDEDTTLKFYEGQDLEFQFTMEGMPVTLFNASDRYTVKVPISIPSAEDVCGVDGEFNCAPVSCKDHTVELVKAINNYVLPTGAKLSTYFDVYPIFSVPTEVTEEIVYKYWELEYCGSGNVNELGKVQAQYPGENVTIKRDTMSDKFVLFAPGAYTPKAYGVAKADVLKGCDTCPQGYTEIEDGFLYSVVLEDDGEDSVEAVEALTANVVAESTVKSGQDHGVGYYILVASKPITDAERKAFITANPTARILDLGKKSAHCANSEVVEFNWVEKSQCTATEHAFEILLADDCEGNRLEELQRQYPDLEITVGESANCVTKYTTKVVTDFSCNDGCSSEIVEQVFTAKAPKPFGVNNFWSPVLTTDEGEETVACGFEIKAKPVVMNPSEAVLDKLPFIATSTRISSISGGYPLDYSMTTRKVGRAFNVLQLERAQDLDNLGGNLRGWEKRGNIYFRNEKYSKDPVQRALTNTESKLDGLTQYALAYIEVDQAIKVGMNHRGHTSITYGYLVPYGKTEKIEEVLKSLASSAGVPFLIK